ncbi:hypothetical protein [Ochrobactrum sp. Q0168]|uniref:hypothetical protein n=1 Tax=Ochrobactrum sp. Q0168 TaxID=2793241 RepID=UPI001FFF60DC
MSIEVRLTVSIELGCGIDTLRVIRRVNAASNPVAAIVVVGVTIVTCCVAVFVLVVRNHPLNNRTEHSTRDDTANIMTMMIILARTRIKSITATVVIATHICKYA